MGASNDKFSRQQHLRFVITPMAARASFSSRHFLISFARVLVDLPLFDLV